MDLLSALLYLNYFDAEVVGYYDGKVMLSKENVDPKVCFQIWMFITKI